MSNIFISEEQVKANARREKVQAAAHHRGSLIRIADRFFKKKQIAETEIARHEREVAEAETAFLALRREHDRHVAAVREIREQIANAEQMADALREKRVEPAHCCFHKITSRGQARSEVLRWSRELNEIDAAIVRCEEIIEQLRAELVVKETALAGFERQHADDLAPVES